MKLISSKQNHTSGPLFIPHKCNQFVKKIISADKIFPYEQKHWLDSTKTSIRNFSSPYVFTTVVQHYGSFSEWIFSLEINGKWLNHIIKTKTSKIQFEPGVDEHCNCQVLKVEGLLARSVLVEFHLDDSTQNRTTLVRRSYRRQQTCVRRTRRRSSWRPETLVKPETHLRSNLANKCHV